MTGGDGFWRSLEKTFIISVQQLLPLPEGISSFIWELPEFPLANRPFVHPWACSLVGGLTPPLSQGVGSDWLTPSHVIGPEMGVSSSLSQ